MERGCVQFTDEEKAKNFDKIAESFYKGNFGQLSKADMELLMFDIYIQKLINDNKKEDNTIDYRLCSDYHISRALGITQAKVRNLKVKNHLAHPIDFDWKASLATLTQNARYDPQSHKITINIPDPNLYYDIQNFIEEQGGYVEYSLNSKIFQIRVEYYIELILAMEPEETRKSAAKIIQKMVKEEHKTESIINEKQIGKAMIKYGINVVSFLVQISQLLSAGAPVVLALQGLIT